MKKNLMVTTILFTLFGLCLAAHSTTMVVPPLPDFPDNEWTVGSAVTYSFTLTEGASSLEGNLRIAVLGTEREAATGTDLYWVELDMTDLRGLPQDAQELFTAAYGEPPTALRANMLIPRYDLNRLIIDPSRVYSDFSAPGFIRKFYFQYNRQTPQDVEPSLIGGFFMPLGATELLNGELPDDFMQSRNLGVTVQEDPQSFRTELSASEQTTGAGTFNGTLFSFTSQTHDGPSGTYFFSENLPFCHCVSLEAAWTEQSVSKRLSVELSSVQYRGAQTQIVGTPELVNWSTLLGGS